MRLIQTESLGNQMFHLMLEILGVPLVTALINLFIGALSDYWPSKIGRRTYFMFWGLGIYLIGAVLMTIAAVYPCVYFWNDTNPEKMEDIRKLYNASLILYIIGNVFGEIGRNIVAVMFNSYILDTFDVVQQDRVNLMKSCMTGLSFVLSYVVFFIISLCTFNWGTDNSPNEFDTIVSIKKSGSVCSMILHIFSIIFMIGGVFWFKYVAQEQQYEGSNESNEPQTKKECFKYLMKTVKDGFKAMDYGVFSAFLIVFFGWLVWGSFVNNYHTLHREYLYPGRDQLDLRFLVYGFDFTLVGVIMMIVSIVIYIKKWRLDIYTIIAFGICTGLSVFLYFLKPTMEPLSMIWRNYFFSSIPFFSASLILTAVKSFPYSLMKDSVPSDKNGVTMGIMFIFVHIGQSTAYLINVALDTTHDVTHVSESLEDDHGMNSYIFINALCFMSFIVSFIFRFVKKIKT